MPDDEGNLTVDEKLETLRACYEVVETVLATLTMLKVMELRGYKLSREGLKDAEKILAHFTAAVLRTENLLDQVTNGKQN